MLDASLQLGELCEDCSSLGPRLRWTPHGWIAVPLHTTSRLLLLLLLEWLWTAQMAMVRGLRG